MKKNIIIIFLLACLSTAMSAQEEKGNIYIQPKLNLINNANSKNRG